jgi:nitrile hydratase accessory protein
LSGHDPVDPERLASLPRLPRDQDGPVFAEPWQAQAFALAVKLSEKGHFTWKEWAATLASELNDATLRGEPDLDGTKYYHHWLAALERLVIAKGLADTRSLAARKDAWEDAYLHTPHGSPVELGPSMFRQLVVRPDGVRWKSCSAGPISRIASTRAAAAGRIAGIRRCRLTHTRASGCAASCAKSFT